MPPALCATAGRGRFQFTLRTAFIAVTMVGVVFGSAKWLGVPGVIGSLLLADLCILAAAAGSRRWRMAAGSAVGLAAPLVLAGLYCLGPWSDVCLVCVVCGKRKEIETFLGRTLRQQEVDTELSKWYREMGMRLHDHQWVHLASAVQDWGGQVMCYDSFGWEVQPLEDLRAVSQKVDQTAFADLAESYYAMREAPTETRIRNFGNRLRELLSADDSTSRDP